MYTSTLSATASDSATNLKRRGIFACVLAVLLAGGLYINALNNDFIYDDHRLIVENPSLADLTNLRAIFWRDASRPVVNFSYAVDRAVWGMAPFGFHLTNLLLHMLNVGLFALLSWRAAGDLRARMPPPPALPQPHVVAPVAALLFAVHPMVGSAVGYISGRSELLCGAFVLLALLAARRWIVTKHARWILPAALFWSAALASKEIAAMFPFILLAYDRWIAAGDPAEERRRLLHLHLPIFAIAGGLAALRLFVFTSVEHGEGITLQWQFALVELDVIRRYITMLFVPVGQAIFHDVRPVGLTDSRALTAIAAIVVLLGFAWSRRKTLPLASFGVLWLILLLLPSSALVILDRGEPMVEHRVYFASCGFFLAAGLAADRLAAALARGRTPALAVVAAAVLAVVVPLAGRTVVRNQLWGQPALVWLEAAERAPDHWLPPLLLGEELHRTGRHEQAIGAYRRVLQLRPQEVSAYGKLGVCLSEQGDLTAAEDAFGRLRAVHARSPEASNGLATVALLRGQIDAARRGYHETLAFDPSNIAARRGLAVLEETVGANPAEALRWCEEIARIAPGTPGNDECIRRNQARLAGRRDDGR